MSNVWDTSKISNDIKAIRMTLFRFLFHAVKLPQVNLFYRFISY